MEFVYLGVGILTAFTCMFFYRRGVKDGMKIKHDQPLEPIKKPDILKTTEEKTRDEVDKKAQEEEREIAAQFQALVNFQPEYTTKREA